VKALWLPFEVTDLDGALTFYVDRLGLVRTDGWARDGERGAVLRATGTTYVELVQPAGRAPRNGAPLAFELQTAAAVDAAFAAVAPSAGELTAPPHRYPRGHYGFTMRAPAGAEVMLWSEAE
jgi:predicted enzyme related to lactoylglutathione lyase